MYLEVSRIDSILPQSSSLPTSSVDTSSFGQMLVASLQQTEMLHQQASGQFIAYASGQNIPTHDLIISMEKAKMALQLTLEVRNRLLDAYQEIAKTQL